MPGKGKFSREDGFLGGGPVFARKRGSESFWGKCLKRIQVSDNASFQKNRDGRITVVYIYIYTGDSIQKILNIPGKGKFSREEGFLGGAVFARKRGLESFWGKCLK